MIKIALCDDDMDFSKKTLQPLLSRAIKEANIQADVRFFSDGFELLREFENNNIYDIVIIDIEMPTINGKELAGKLRSIDSAFCLAFVSAYKEEVFATIPYGISAFIPKEYNIATSLEALTNLLRNISQRNSQFEFFNILIDGVRIARRIPVKSIYYFDYDSGNITLHTKSESFILTDRILDKIARKYVPRGFYRIRRNYLVNVEKVYEVLDNEVVLDNKNHLPISRRRRKELIVGLSGVV